MASKSENDEARRSPEAHQLRKQRLCEKLGVPKGDAEIAANVLGRG